MAGEAPHVTDAAATFVGPDVLLIAQWNPVSSIAHPGDERTVRLVRPLTRMAAWYTGINPPTDPGWREDQAIFAFQLCEKTALGHETCNTIAIIRARPAPGGDNLLIAHRVRDRQVAFAEGPALWLLVEIFGTTGIGSSNRSFARIPPAIKQGDVNELRQSFLSPRSLTSPMDIRTRDIGEWWKRLQKKAGRAHTYGLGHRTSLGDRGSVMMLSLSHDGDKLILTAARHGEGPRGWPGTLELDKDPGAVLDALFDHELLILEGTEESWVQDRITAPDTLVFPDLSELTMMLDEAPPWLLGNDDLRAFIDEIRSTG